MHPKFISFSWLWELIGKNPADAPAIHTYGLMIALGFMVGMQLGAREARRTDISKEGGFDQFILDLTFWILPVSIAGSRILFIIVEWDRGYSQDLGKIFRIWEGGFVFYGGLISAVLFSIYYCRRKGRSFLRVADILIPSVALGHFFGRIGCLAAGCCWGVHVDPDFIFGIQFPEGAMAYNSMVNNEVIARGASHSLHVHPVQLYESFGELMLFFTLIIARTGKRFHGQVLLMYLFLYPLLRTSLEFLRGDKQRGEYELLGATVSTSQIISGIVAICAIALLTVLVSKRSQATKPPASSAGMA